MTDSPAASRLLITISGRDQPGITAELTGAIVAAEAELIDVDQVVVHGQLTLCVVVAATPAREARVLDEVRAGAARRGLSVDARPIAAGDAAEAPAVPLAVTVFGERVDAGGLHRIARVLAGHGGNILRIHRLSEDDLSVLELSVALPVDAGHDGARVEARMRELRRDLLAEIGPLDVAVQEESLSRRAKRLVAMDMDSTLIQMEVIDELARRRGVADEVAELTRRAMHGELDFEQSLRARVARLAGLEARHLDEIAAALPLTDGAATLVRVLSRLGYRTAVISGGFTFAAQALKRQLGLDYAYANTLEVVDGRVTGRVLDPIVTPQRKADLLDLIAQGERIDRDQTIAIGDGANDLPMLDAAALGIAFHAKPKLTAAADTAISHGSLDRVLYLLGLRAADIRALR